MRVASSFVRNSEDFKRAVKRKRTRQLPQFHSFGKEGCPVSICPGAASFLLFSFFFFSFLPPLSVRETQSVSFCLKSKAFERGTSWKDGEKKESRLSPGQQRGQGQEKGKFMYVPWRNQRHLRGIPSGPSVFRFSERFGSTGQLRETVAPSVFFLFRASART